MPKKGFPSPNIRPKPTSQKIKLVREKAIKFWERRLTAFFWRQNPASRREKPIIIKKTRQLAKMTQAVSRETCKVC